MLNIDFNELKSKHALHPSNISQSFPNKTLSCAQVWFTAEALLYDRCLLRALIAWQTTQIFTNHRAALQRVSLP